MSFLLWFVYFPILRFLWAMVFWIPELQERKRFEKRNAGDPLCASFREQGLVADYCFEFSSEGEYQQVAPLIDDALRLGKRIELVFFSPSVEKAIVNLARAHENQIRYLRYPLVSFAPWGRSRSFSGWITARKLYLVRYDLLPEFLFWSGHSEHELTILWATFKKERLKEKRPSLWKRAFFSRARHVVYASSEDQELGLRLGFSGSAYDFRIEQIRRRLKLREEKFRLSFPQYDSLRRNWERWPKEKRLIVGNAWPSDLFLLEKLPEDVFLLVVPHQLTPEVLRAFKEGLERLGRDPIEVSEGASSLQGDTIVLNKKGVLCELYADFGLAYVGGGFEAGVHSILEPLVAQVPRIACGPKNQRSTEFDVARSLKRMSEVVRAEEFANWVARTEHLEEGSTLSEVFAKYESNRKEVISC